MPPRTSLAAAFVFSAVVAACGPQPTPEATVASSAPTQPATSAPEPVATATATATATSAPEASATAAATATPADAPAVTTLFVREKRADCVGEGPMKCLQVRDTETADWRLLYTPIEGFTYDEGHAYQLKVEARSTPNPPQGGASSRYKLVEVVSKKKAGGK